MSDERFIEIEMKLAHQDQALIELNAALTKQQESIMTLESLCASMVEQFAAMNEASPGMHAGDDQPPHY